MKNFATSSILIAVLIVQPLCAQEIVKIPLGGQAEATSPKPGVLAEGTQIRFVLLDSVSSATAAKGQQVRFAVAQDVVIDGMVVIPRGTQASGVVARVRKGIPDKHNGTLELKLHQIQFTNGKKLNLVRSTEDCQVTNVGCWVLIALATATFAVFLPVELPSVAFYAIKNPRHRRVLTPVHSKIEGTDQSLEPCEIDTAYTAREFKFSTTKPPATDLATEAILNTLDACAAH